MDNVFFLNGISIWHLPYITVYGKCRMLHMIHNHLKIYYLHYHPSGMLED